MSHTNTMDARESRSTVTEFLAENAPVFVLVGSFIGFWIVTALTLGI